MFNKRINKVCVFLYEDVKYYPPVINLVECLLNNGFKTLLVSQNTANMPDIVVESPDFSSITISSLQGEGIINRVTRRFSLRYQFVNALTSSVSKNDILWTVNPLVVRTLGKSIDPYSNNHVMELLELTDWVPLFRGARFVNYNIKNIAQKAKGIVVPEINRAYIQKVFWDLDKVPYVFPNKPYYNDPGELTPQIEAIINQMKSEERKIILYLGVIDPDRSIEEFIKAIESVKEEYILYAFGKLTSHYKRGYLEKLVSKYESFRYMGFFNPPQHLHFIKQAHIALLPYNPGEIYGKSFSKLNALYCAPNKLYEYAGYGIPMVGTDVLALREPFEKYNIGFCSRSLNGLDIVEAIHQVDAHYEEMSINCELFYNSVDLNKLIVEIIEGINR